MKCNPDCLCIIPYNCVLDCTLTCGYADAYGGVSLFSFSGGAGGLTGVSGSGEPLGPRV